MPHLPVIPKTHFKTRVRMHALAELFPSPELTNGRMGPSKYCYGTDKARVRESIVRLGLDFPRLREARLRVMRRVEELSEIFVQMLEASEDDDGFADKAPRKATIKAIRDKTHPSEPYAAAARSQLRLMGLGDLCVTPEEA